MSAFGSMFPGQRIRHEAGEAGDGEQYLSFGPIDLESGTVTLQGATPPVPESASEPSAPELPATEHGAADGSGAPIRRY